MTTKSLNIGIIYAERFPWNRGIGQLYKVLESIGHKPIVLSKASNHAKASKSYKHYKFKNLRNSDGLIAKLKSYPNLYNPYWKLFIDKMIQDHKLDCIFLRETTIIRQAVKSAKKANIPIFIDLRENAFLNLSSKENNRSIYNLATPKTVHYRESKFLPQCSHILTVTKELKDWIIHEYSLKEDIVSTYGNFPEEKFTKAVGNYEKERKIYLPIKLIFTGFVTENRGLQNIISSLPIILKNHDCHLTIIGEGNYLNSLKQQVSGLNLNKHVLFKPMLPADKVAEELTKYDIGLCPYLINEMMHQTIPGKLFEFMSACLPVFASARKPVERIVNQEKCGKIFGSTNPQDIADSFSELVKDEKLLIQMGINGRKAIENTYNNDRNIRKLNKILSSYFF